MDPQLIAACVILAVKVGKEVYDQISELVGPSIPTWAQLKSDNAELQAMIDAEK